MLVWKGVRAFSDEEPAGDVLADVRGSGKTSRLYKALVFERQLASGISAFDASLGLAGWFQINVTAAHGHHIPELLPVVQQILAEVKKSGVTAEEVDRATPNTIANPLPPSDPPGANADL